MNPGPAILAQGVSFSYGVEPVLENVNLSLPRGDFVSIVGPNGGGKTTLLKVVLGLVEPNAGHVAVLGASPIEARRRVGYLPQYAHLDPQFPVNVLDVVLTGRIGCDRRWWGPYGRADRQSAMDALEEVRLHESARRPFCDLSGGQRQRALIARALASRPELLLLDEPTANLDPRVQDDFYALMRRLAERLTVVLVSHDVGFVSHLVRTVVCVNRQVSVHASSELSGKTIVELYGQEVRLVHHHH